jgi:hypothetical protein
MAVRSSSLRRAVAVLAFATVLVPACAANAAAYVFTVTGPNTASFTLNSSPTPDATGTGFFTVQNVPGTYNGTGVTFGQLTFFASGVASGGFFASGTALNLEAHQSDIQPRHVHARRWQLHAPDLYVVDHQRARP